MKEFQQLSSLNTTSIEKLLQLADTKNRKDLEDSEIVRKFAGEKQFFKNMLGIDTPHSPVGGKFAEEIRATIRRVSTGHLNEADKRRIRATELFSERQSIMVIREPKYSN